MGATGAALICKVANFTIGKEKYKAVEEEVKNILKRSEDLRNGFIKLCSDDAKAYKKLSDVFRLPKKEERSKKLQEALKEAMDAPFQVCKASYEAIKLCAPLAEKGNINLITDVGDGALMLLCAFKSALLNVEINLKSIKDDKFVSGIRKDLEAIEGEIDGITKEVARKVEEAIR